MKTKTFKLSWKPKRNGDVYCSPACGGKCTWAAYQKAKRGAAALAKTMGPGWKPKVWENLGWHFKVVRGDGGSVYSLDRGGHEHWADIHIFGDQYSAYHSDPKVAFERAEKSAMLHLFALAEALNVVIEMEKPT